jgi:cytochrome c-type biogenesis protein
VNLLGHTLHLHSTSLLSGLLLILVGYLLASGNLAFFSQQAANTSMGEWALNIEQWIDRTFRAAR